MEMSVNIEVRENSEGRKKTSNGLTKQLLYP
jgi:hypothetical protein